MKDLVGFGLVTLAVGQICAGVAFFLIPFNPGSSSYVQPSFYPPAWMFPVVWVFVYSAMGISAGYVWRQRKNIDVTGLMVCFILLLIATLVFVPIMNLSGGNPGVMTMLDINAFFAASLYCFLCRRYNMRAYYWAMVLVVWTVITTAFKISLWLENV